MITMSTPPQHLSLPPLSAPATSSSVSSASSILAGARDSMKSSGMGGSVLRRYEIFFFRT